jgi:hypothetical protein
MISQKQYSTFNKKVYSLRLSILNVFCNIINWQILFLLFFLFLNLVSFSQTTFTITLNTPGSRSWEVPCGVTTITVQCWGGGGAGGNAIGSGTAGGGGGGGEYATSTLTGLTPGTLISYTVGAGGVPSASTSTVASSGSATTFSASATLKANGGSGGSGSSSGIGAGGSGGTAGVGTTTNNGNNGSSGAITGNPKGGGAGGNAGNTAGGGGIGGLIKSTAGTGNNGNAPGGGGGGGYDNNGGGTPLSGTIGGAGGNGQINIIYTIPFTVNAGVDITLGTCSTTSVTLSAQALTPGTTGTWSNSYSNISITNPNLTNASAAGAGFTEGSSVSFIWSVTNGSCTYQDEVVVNVPVCSQTNPDCPTAQTLTVDAALRCGQNSNNLGGNADNCVVSGNGETVWYKFTVPSGVDSLVLNVLGQVTPFPHYGVFSKCPTSTTNCTTILTYSLGTSGDPGKHTLLSGITPDSTYYVQVQSSSNANSKFCISINNVSTNSIAPANALEINNCGTTFTGTTNGGYYASGAGTRYANLDNNLNSFVSPYTNTTGNDVSFVVNNISWFKFCTAVAGTFNVNFDVLSCVFTGTNSGSQMAILTGTNTNMTNIWEATNPTYPSTAVQTSPNFNLAANGCAYLVVDGFAGDACSYSYVLTNVSGGCNLLPISLSDFSGIKKEKFNEIKWSITSENNTAYFILEKSLNGLEFEMFKILNAIGESNSIKHYSLIDDSPFKDGTYYRLKIIDKDGTSNVSGIIYIANEINVLTNIVVNYNLPEQVDFIFYSSKELKGNFEIISLTGSSIYKKEINIGSGENIISVNNSNLASGIYFLHVNFNGNSQFQKFIIR